MLWIAFYGLNSSTLVLTYIFYDYDYYSISVVLDEVTVGKFYASVLIQEQYRKYHRKKMASLDSQGESKDGHEVFKLQACHLR